jgi:hypothetical protein
MVGKANFIFDDENFHKFRSPRTVVGGRALGYDRRSRDT